MPLPLRPIFKPATGFVWAWNSGKRATPALKLPFIGQSRYFQRRARPAMDGQAPSISAEHLRASAHRVNNRAAIIAGLPNQMRFSGNQNFAIAAR